MHYEINDIVGFDPLTGLLWAIETPDSSTTLPRFASQLLEILITGNEKSLSREYLMDTIWYNNGLSASGNNLNNYMSIIRRALSSLGLNGIIITIPKYGFSFHAGNIVKVESHPLLNKEESTTEEKEKNECALDIIHPVSLQDTDNHFKVRVKCFSVLVCFFIILTIALSYFAYGVHYPTSASNLYKNKNYIATWNNQRNFFIMEKISIEVECRVKQKKESTETLSDNGTYKKAREKKPFSLSRTVISEPTSGS